jgi:hypothetical protein
MLPHSIEFECNQSEYPFDIKIVGRDTLLSVSDMIFMHQRCFKLQYHLISDDTAMTIKNIAPPQDKILYELTCTIKYHAVNPEIIFNSTYKNLCNYNTLIDDIIKYKNIYRIVIFGNGIESINLIPKCESTPVYYKSYEMKPIDDIISIDNQDFISNVTMYNLNIIGAPEKIGLIIYGTL